MSEEIAAADALLKENARLRDEIAHRAKIDAEDMHRIQDRHDHLYRQFESLQKWVARGMAPQPPPPIYVDADVLALLAELDAALAFIQDIRSDVVGGLTDKQLVLLATYDEARKARHE